jgi:hypothetical protein
MPNLQQRKTPFVFAGHDSRVIVEDVDAVVALGRRLVELLDARGVGDVGPVEERVAALGRRRLAGVGVDVGDAHLRALAGEEERRLAPDAPGRAGDHADLAVEPPHGRANLSQA